MIVSLLSSLLGNPPARFLMRTPRIGPRTDPIAFLGERLEHAPKVLSELGDDWSPAGTRVLDVGCAMGDRAVAVARAGAHRVLGIDTDPEKIRWGQLLARHTSVDNVVFSVGDIGHAAVSDDQFDLVLLLDVLEHLERPEEALAECARVLVPGGRLLVTFPPYRSPWGGHLFGHIAVPWAHLIFADSELLRVWRRRHLRAVAAGRSRCTPHRSRCIMNATTVSELWSLNQMTIARFADLVARSSFTPVAVRFTWYGRIGSLVRLRGEMAELLVTRVVAILEA